MAFARLASLLYVVIVALFTATASRAASEVAGLRGISELDVEIEGLNSNSAQCGITELDIKNAISYPLVVAGLKIIPETNLVTCYTLTLRFM
jgi:hypothetical protein